jgi:predicted secreted protein
VAQLAGKNAQIKHGGTAGTAIAELADWNIDINVDTIEVTAFGDEARARIYGLYDWSGSVEGSWDVQTAASKQIEIQNAALNKTPFEIAAYVDGSIYYGGTVLVTGISVSTPIEDKVGVSIDFEGSGGLTYGTA